MINFYKDGRVHAYFKGILKSIYNLKNRCMELGIARRYPIAEYAPENNIAHATNVCFGSQVFTDDISSILGDSCVPESGLVRHSFGGSLPVNQRITKQTAEKHQGNSREIAQDNQRNSRETAMEVQGSPHAIAEKKHRNGKEIAEDRHRKSRAEAEVFTEISRAEAEEVVFSDKLRTNFVPTSNILRVGFESASNFLRVKPYENSKPTRIKLDKKPKNGRIRSEERGNKVGGRTGVSEDRLFSNSGQLRTVFVPASENVRPAKYRLITFQHPFLGEQLVRGCVRGVQEMGEGRSRFEGSTNPVPRMYCLGTVSSLGRYRKGTGSVLRSYWRGTKEVLRSYWRCTGISTIVVSSAREAGSSSLEGSLSQISAFKASKFLRQVFTHVESDNSLNRLKNSLNFMQGGVDGVGNKGVVRFFGSARFSIAPILLLLLTFGALTSQGQMLHKDSGAVGQLIIKPLKTGESIPDEIWEMSFVFHDLKKGAKTIKLKELKGKVLLFDFWSTTCKSCIEGFPKMEELQKKYGKDLAIVLVNSKRNKDTPQRLKAVFDNYKSTYDYELGLPTILDDTVFTNLFPHNTIPTHVWVDRAGRLVGMTKTADEIDNKVQSLINGEGVYLLEMGMIVNEDRSYNPPLVDTVGKLSTSIFAKARPNFLPTQKNVYYQNGHTYFQLGNHSLFSILQYTFYDELKDYMLYQFVFDPQLSQGNPVNMIKYLRKDYWYEMYSSDSINRQTVKDWVRADVMRHFQLEVIQKKEIKDVYELELTPGFNKIQSNKGMLSRVSYLTEDEIQLNHIILFYFLNLLCPYLDRPVVVGDEKRKYFNLKLPKGFIHFSMGKKLNFLASQGILLKPVKKEIEFPSVAS